MDFRMITEHRIPDSHELSEQELTDDELSRASLTFNPESTLTYAVVPVLGQQLCLRGLGLNQVNRPSSWQELLVMYA